jgi:hypothetical protein
VSYRPRKQSTSKIDFIVEGRGSLIMLRCLTIQAKDWAINHIGTEGFQSNWDDALVIEPRYFRSLFEEIRAEGFNVQL